jgi:hypothetical protein
VSLRIYSKLTTISACEAFIKGSYLIQQLVKTSVGLHNPALSLQSLTGIAR